MTEQNSLYCFFNLAVKGESGRSEEIEPLRPSTYIPLGLPTSDPTHFGKTDQKVIVKSESSLYKDSIHLHSSSI